MGWFSFGKDKQIQELQLQVAQLQVAVFQLQVTCRSSLTLLNRVLFRLGPGPVRVVPIGENAMADKISFLVKLPPKSAPDVVRRILTVNIGEDNQTGIDTDKELTEFGPLTGDEGAAIKITLVDVDNAGNQSEPSVFEGVLADTFAPPAPGAIGVVAVGESFEQEPAPEPTPNPAPVDPPVEEVPSGPQGAQDVPPSDA